MTLEQLEREILKLSPAERLRLAEHLLAVLEGDAGVSEAWYEEAERRLGQMRAGVVREVPAEDVFRSLGLDVGR